MRSSFLVVLLGLFGGVNATMAGPLSFDSSCHPFALRAAYESLLQSEKSFDVRFPGEGTVQFGPKSEVLSVNFEVSTKNDYVVRLRLRENGKMYVAKTAVHVPERHRQVCNGLRVGWSGLNDFVVSEVR